MYGWSSVTNDSSKCSQILITFHLQATRYRVYCRYFYSSSGVLPRQSVLPRAQSVPPSRNTSCSEYSMRLEHLRERYARNAERAPSTSQYTMLKVRCWSRATTVLLRIYMLLLRTLEVTRGAIPWYKVRYHWFIDRQKAQIIAGDDDAKPQ